MIELKTEVDIEVFRRYAGLSLPRHVSYPMPTWWQKLDATEVDALIQECRYANPPNALSLYLHIPFCEHLCKFCACTKVILRKSARDAGNHVETYNDAIVTEIERLAERVDADRPLRQIHWGGGTPTYLADDQIERIHRTIERAFRIEPDAEIAMEIDPRTVSPAKLKALKDPVAKRPPDLLLLDIMMPKLSGYEVCEQLKANDKTRDIPILIVTALNKQGDIERAVSAGCDDFLTKPVNGLELKTRVRSLLRVRHLTNEVDRLLEYLAEVEKASAANVNT